MKTLPPDLFKKYSDNPIAMDEEVRKYCNLPDNRYYTVSMWPQEGIVRSNDQVRTVKAKKISKSDQKE
jgi:hypothetical protein